MILVNYLILWLSKLLAILPFRVLYVLSDILYLKIYYIIRYRKSVVFQNLQNSFPDKTQKEIKKIAKQFYKNFCDHLVEMNKTRAMGADQIKEKVKIKNPELLNEYVQSKKSVIILTGHIMNWEWAGANLQTYFPEFKCIVTAKPLSNQFLNDYIMEERNKHVLVVNAKYILKTLIQYKNSPTLTFLIADQRPPQNELDYWTTFLHQDTPFFLGAEKISRSFNYPVLYFYSKKIKRGYYETEIIKISDTPKLTKEFEITESYTRLLEQTILQQPDNWLWTHKRWKFSKINNLTNN